MTNHEEDILYGDNPDRNPCSFKSICQHCTKVHIQERPVICQQLECPEYQPCPQCHNNRDLDPVHRICVVCVKENNKKKTPALSPADKAVARGRKKFDGFVTPEAQAVIDKAAAQITGVPGGSEFDDLGTAPASLTVREKNYFNQRWSEYEGFYRDPSAYFIIHQMILAEIASRRTETQILESQMELHTEKIKEKKEWLDYIALLKKQLPEREAQRENDAESALNHIFNQYLTDKHVRHNGTVSRVFSPEAIAIAPQLLFKPDLESILVRLGYKVEDIHTAIDRLPDLGDTPEKALEALGYNLNERYAMPYTSDEEYGEGDGQDDLLVLGGAEEVDDLVE